MSDFIDFQTLHTHLFPDQPLIFDVEIPYPISLDNQGLALHHPQLKIPFILYFDQGGLKRRQNQHGELLFKATGAARKTTLHIVDATAGLGRESVLMASAGAFVSSFECQPLLYCMLQDAWNRCTDLDIKQRLQFYWGRAQDHFSVLAQEHSLDVIYLDPMFPKRTKKAAVKREAMVLQSLSRISSIEEEHDLLERALDYAQYRVVVKRPLKAPPLAQRNPTASLKGKMIRYDLYGKKKLP